MENKDKDSDIPLSQKPWDPATMTYDQLGEFLGKTLSKLHEEEMKKFKQKQKKDKK